jgi:hypothetical protein
MATLLPYDPDVHLKCGDCGKKFANIEALARHVARKLKNTLPSSLDPSATILAPMQKSSGSASSSLPPPALVVQQPQRQKLVAQPEHAPIQQQNPKKRSAASTWVQEQAGRKRGKSVKDDVHSISDVEWAWDALAWLSATDPARWHFLNAFGVQTVANLKYTGSEGAKMLVARPEFKQAFPVEYRAAIAVMELASLGDE